MAVKTEHMNGARKATLSNVSKAKRTNTKAKRKFDDADLHVDSSPIQSSDEINTLFKNRVGEIVSLLTKISNRYAKFGLQFLKQNPLKGLAVAASAGFIAGALVTLSLRKRQ